ncbi:MAG: choice-of-anchor Q domain-containing protein [Thermomicrobiales bacterium]
MIVLIARLPHRVALAGLLLALLISPLTVQEVGATTHCVNPGGTMGCFASIQAAINDSGTVDGDTINVAANNPLQTSYNENVTVNKSVSIVGAGMTTTILDGTTIGDVVLTIPAGKTVSISGFTINDMSGPNARIVNNGALTVTDSTITLTYQTGGISNKGNAILTLNNSTLNGSLSNDAGTVGFSNSTLGSFSGTKVSVSNTGTGTVTLSNNSFGWWPVTSNNGRGTVALIDSTVVGSFFFNNGSGNMTMVRARLSDSTVTNHGTGTMTITDSTMAGNGTGPGITNSTNGRIEVSNTMVQTYNAGPNGFGAGLSNLGMATLVNVGFMSNGLRFPAQRGGGIYNTGTLTLTNSTVASSAAMFGGGLYNTGTATLTNSTLDYNDARDSHPVFGGGGGIYNDIGATLTLINSTLTSNTTGGSIGAGILNLGTMKVVNDTIANNSASQPQSTPAKGGGIANYSALTMSNTIVANNVAAAGGPDVLGSITSGGHNLIGNTSDGSGFVGSDLQNVNPQLGPLANNGGPTQTMALQVGSPAIGAADLAICTAAPPNGAGGYDQRGFRRFPPACSIGAYENTPMSLPPPKPTAPPIGSPTAVPAPRPTGVPVIGATPNPLPPHR